MEKEIDLIRMIRNQVNTEKATLLAISMFQKLCDTQDRK